jgi:hypothetical protein
MVQTAVGLSPLAGGDVAHAHGTLHDQIRAVTRSIADDPADARKYWHRGELRHQVGTFADADADFERALGLEPDLHGVHLSRARLLLDWGKPRDALASADRFLEHDPGNADAHWTRAGALAATGNVDDAVREMDVSIEGASDPQPDRYLERARLIVRRGTRADIAWALDGLDDGMRRLGIVPTLQLYAIELEERRGSADGARARRDQLSRQRPTATRDPLLESAARTHETHDARRATAVTARAATVTRGPYLSIGTPGSVVVRWRTDIATDSRVRYGPAVGNLTTTADDATVATEHIVTVTGLASETRYYYSVGSTIMALAGDDADHSFRTHPTPGVRRPVRVWAIGDSGEGNQNARDVRDAYLAYPGSGDTDVWLMLGDNAYNTGLDTEYQAAVFDTYPQLLRNTILWPTRGNHDVLHAGANNDYYEIFTLPTAGEAGGVASGTEAYYSFDFANVHFMCLDSEGSNRTPGGAMLTWAALDLAATTQEWIVAFWHHPPYSKGSHDSDTETQLVEMREYALPLLEAGGVDLVLAGHSHSYERSMLIDEHYGLSTTLADSMKLDAGDGDVNGDGAYRKPTAGPAAHEGTVYAVAGSSAKTSGGALNHPVMVRSLNLLGSLVLDVDGDRLDATFIDENGAALDAFRIVKGAVVAVEKRPAAAFALEQNAPNPFNPSTTIRFSTPVAAVVDLTIYDVTGRRVATLLRRAMPAGEWTTAWDARDERGIHVPSGVYFNRLTARTDVATKKIVLLK